MLGGANVKIINELTQFNHYIDIDDNYSKWIQRNVSGDKDIDSQFLMGELKKIDDDPFDLKKDAVGRELKNIIDSKALAQKEIP